MRGRLLHLSLHRREHAREFSAYERCPKRCHNHSDVTQGSYACLVIYALAPLLLLWVMRSANVGNAPMTDGRLQRAFVGR